MIPKKLHLYWGLEPMSWLSSLTVDSFVKYNQDWEIYLYTPPARMAPVTTSPPYTGNDYFDRVKSNKNVTCLTVDPIEYDIPDGINAAQFSDIIAFNALHKYGGVYGDFDVLWLQSWDNIVNTAGIGMPEKMQALVSYSELTRGWHSVGVLASEKGSDFMWSVIQMQRSQQPPYSYESFGSAMLNRNYPIYETIVSRFDRMYFIAYNAFYPYHLFKLDRLYQKTDLSPIDNRVMCVHWFAGHPLAKQYINAGEYYDCSMTEILRKEGYL